ncbi:hypothetical protein BU23DRAFT_139450 [Bimuria novae-zelandiae CBS 107.79]|uniref:Hydantoinase B/oxoprolinase domain-containing protein n=1 Tax=Bimuria novae-zelandiae CBS 107.79 TaxID=1447943 RepID=A0A6A5VDR4_9PLEO|nr:hypothetical protein BU23DRAFT_139450 [Bimuria novae-zelandiae CBS 107.79]
MHKGGNGVIHDMKCRAPLKFSVITERRVTEPYGIKGGENSGRGANYWVTTLGRETWSRWIRAIAVSFTRLVAAASVL